MKILNSKIIGDSEKHIIILHGLFGMGENWNSVALNLSNYGFSVHLVDQRNHGKSFWNDKISYKIMSNDLLEYFNYYKIKNAFLIGHSMGGKTAMKFALEFPSKVLKLISKKIPTSLSNAPPPEMNSFKEPPNCSFIFFLTIFSHIIFCTFSKIDNLFFNKSFSPRESIFLIRYFLSPFVLLKDTFIF